MSYADALLGGDHAKAKSHIRNLIRIASADGTIDDKEWKLLIRIARKFELSEEDVKDIMNKIDSMSFTPPANKEDRNLQLYNLGRMVLADGEKDTEELKKINRFAIGLGYRPDTVEGLVDKVISMIEAGSSSEDAIEAIQKYVGNH
jgi:uncharacterized tellurite resistance protein B-like protein